MGRADGTPVPGAFGGDLAAPVLFQAFNRLKPDLDPLPPPPPATLLVSNAQLPQPLQRFRSRSAAFQPQDAPAVAFPPDGAEVELLRRRAAGPRQRRHARPSPGWPMGCPSPPRSATAPPCCTCPGTGFVTLSVIDATGQSARAAVRLTRP